MIPVYYKEITNWRRIIPFISHEWKGSNTIRSLEDLPSPSDWWFQPIWKILYSQIGSSPQVGMKIKNIWNHHLDMVINHFNKSWDPPPSRWPFLFCPLLVGCSAPFQNSVPPTRSASSPYRHGREDNDHGSYRTTPRRSVSNQRPSFKVVVRINTYIVLVTFSTTGKFEKDIWKSWLFDHYPFFGGCKKQKLSKPGCVLLNINV